MASENPLDFENDKNTGTTRRVILSTSSLSPPPQPPQIGRGGYYIGPNGVTGTIGPGPGPIGKVTVYGEIDNLKQKLALITDITYLANMQIEDIKAKYYALIAASKLLVDRLDNVREDLQAFLDEATEKGLEYKGRNVKDEIAALKQTLEDIGA